ncbi:Cupin domain-containing protein [Cladophialophora immunda]|nr:Cupin domain-containing protein [Cladophialophora immunda]
MPSTIIPASRNASASSRQASGTFTGTVWMDPIHSDAGPNININHVMFTPGARTYWHTHEKGQLLRVLAGAGWVCDKGGEPRRLGVGDTVWCAPGTTHWHGGDDGSFMLHLAVSHGKTVWHDEVTEQEYQAKKK